MNGLLLSAVGTAVTAAVGVLAVGIVVFAIVWHFVQKKRGKTGCGCDCSHCGGCCSCPSASEKGAPKENK